MTTSTTLAEDRVRELIAEHRSLERRFQGYHNTEVSWDRPSQWDARAADLRQTADGMSALLAALQSERLRAEKAERLWKGASAACTRYVQQREEAEARAQPPPPSYDGSKSLGERLYESAAGRLVDRPYMHVPWCSVAPRRQAGWEAAALNFTARLSDRGEGLGGPNPLHQIGANLDAAYSSPLPTPIAPQDPPWPPGGADNNSRRAGWAAFHDGRVRDSCPFPPARHDLKRGYQEGWDEAQSATPSDTGKASG